ncbi:condensation domain-containing protein [Streptomyces halobius]|uniref:Condensation domain-containing protein n=1 Tax=Streptomyces halobius TaxID=2879846 RepID=A0ABY4M8T5_9ACTN|nr:condensation domain-containing protein [Streptomyces halobius]UQA94191.1 condensation domain-containing protein [Streptomyces halobius]
MLMTPITQYAPESGELVEFQVSASALAAAAAAPVHPAPPSYVQENHIRRRLANQAAGRSQSPWLGVVFDVPGRLDTAAMAAALEKWIRRHPTFLTWFTVDEGAGMLRRHALPADELSLEPVALAGQASSLAIRERLMQRFDTGTDPLRWPPFVAGAVVRNGESRQSSVYFAVDHAHTDGFSTLLVFSELRALYEAELAGTEAELPEVGSYVDFCALDREQAARIDAQAPEVGRWLQFFLDGPPPSFPLDLGTEPGGTYDSRSIGMDLLSAREADAFSAACKGHGAGFSAGLLAAVAISGYELGGHPSYRGLSVVHTRDEPRWQQTQGWFVNLVPIEFPVADGQAGFGRFGEVVGRAQQAFVAAHGLAGVSPLRVAELLPGLPVQSDATAVLPMVSYMDLRHAPGSRDWAAANCNALVGPGSSGEVPIWVNRLWDRTYLKTRYPDTEVAQANVPRFFDHLGHVLREVARTGEYRIGAPLPTPETA